MISQRRLIVGVIGGDDNMRRGEELGREIAQRGWILLTGGQILERAVVEPTGAVKDASMLGAHAAAGEGARLVCILRRKRCGGGGYRLGCISSTLAFHIMYGM
jgi:hypothetical protein